MSTVLTIVLIVIALVVGFMVGGTLSAMAYKGRMDARLWDLEKGNQETVNNLSNEIYALQDLVNDIKYLVKTGKLKGDPAHALNVLNQFIAGRHLEGESDESEM